MATFFNCLGHQPSHQHEPVSDSYSFASSTQHQPQHQHNPFNPMTLFNVEGMVVVVTGGGTGIGLMIASALENNGAIVYIVGRRLEVLEKAAREHSRFNNIIPLQGNVADREHLLRITEIIKERHGYVDLLINNAGVARNLYRHPLPTPFSSPSANPLSPPGSPTNTPSVPSIRAFQDELWNTGSQDDFAETFSVNVTAVYYTTIAFLDLLHQGNLRKHHNNELEMTGLTPQEYRPPHHSSQVLTISSSGSFRLDARVLSPSYTLSKHATTHLGKLLANLLSPWGIRSNVLAPGVWPSEMTTEPTPGFKLSPSMLAQSVPLRRVGTEEDMAGTILFLASRAGAYVNGAVWLVDGGRVGSVASSY